MLIVVYKIIIWLCYFLQVLSPFSFFFCQYLLCFIITAVSWIISCWSIPFALATLIKFLSARAQWIEINFGLNSNSCKSLTCNCTHMSHKFYKGCDQLQKVANYLHRLHTHIFCHVKLNTAVFSYWIIFLF